MPLRYAGPGSDGTVAPGRYTTDALQVLWGKGTPFDPYHGFFFQSVGNFNAAARAFEIPIAGTQNLVLVFRRLMLRYVGSAAGVTVEPTVFLFEGGGAVQFAIAEKQITQYATDVLAWDLGAKGVAFRFNNQVTNGNLNGSNAYPYLQLQFANYDAGDDIYLLVELDWIVRDD